MINAEPMPTSTDASTATWGEAPFRIPAEMTTVWPQIIVLDVAHEAAELQNDGTLIIGSMIIQPTLEGRPLRSLWDGAESERRLVCIGFSAEHGNLLDAAEIEAINAAIAARRFVDPTTVHDMVIAGQMRAQPTPESVAAATLTKLRTGDRPGYMRQWHSRTGAVRTAYDEGEMLRQLTGYDWSITSRDTHTHRILAMTGVTAIFGDTEKDRHVDEFMEDITTTVTTTDGTRHEVVSTMHEAGVVALIQYFEDEATEIVNRLVITLVSAGSGKITDRLVSTREIDLSPTIQPRVRKSRKG